MSSYKEAGVDIDAGEEAVDRIKSHVARTKRPGVTGSIGGFGGLFNLAAAGHEAVSYTHLTLPTICSV